MLSGELRRRHEGFFHHIIQHDLGAFLLTQLGKDVSGNELNMGSAHITESIQTKGGMIQVIDKVIK